MNEFYFIWQQQISHGSMCSKGLAVTQMAYNPDRILHPMKKSNGDWQRISWDEALETVAGKFKEAQEKYGAEWKSTP